nr:hypothetical protein [Nocardia xishanensis]
MSLDVAVQCGDELAGTHDKARFFSHFLLDGLGGGFARVAPSPGWCPPLVLAVLDQQDAAEGVEHTGSDIDLGGAVAGLGSEDRRQLLR